MKKTCQSCGKEFEGVRAQKYCSTDCRDEGMRVSVDLVCQHCGKTFQRKPWEVTQGRNKYCDPSCYHASRIGRETPKRLRRVEKTCVVCGKTFTVGGRTHKRLVQDVCSVACSRLTRYRRGTWAKELTPIDTAYLAGFLDGEGSIMLARQHDTVQLRVSATNTNLDVLNWIAEVTGVGAVNNHRAEDERVAATFMWQCNAEAAETLLRQLLPYLKIKQEQAALAIETQERLRDLALKADRTWQEEYRQRMKFMNRRGPRSQKDSG